MTTDQKTQEIIDFDPNLTCRRAVKKVRLTLGVWQYRKKLIVELPGNVFGLDLIRYAVEEAYEQCLVEGRDADDLVCQLFLSGKCKTNGEQNELEYFCEDEREFEKLIIGAEIIAFT